MTETLKPCPFCGGVVALMWSPLRKHYVHCWACEVDGPGRSDVQRAVEAWNTRAAPREPGEAERTEQIAAAFRAGFHAAAPPGTDDIEWEQGEWLDYQAALSASRPDAGDGTGEPT